MKLKFEEGCHRMEEKTIDLSKSVYELSNQHPEIIDILKELGFQDITKPGMLSTVGRCMTIPKGAAAKKIDLASIKNAMLGHGFVIKG